MHILITGATGLIGRHLVAKLLTFSHTITVLTRDIYHAKTTLGEQPSYITLQELDTLDNVDAIINLAGEPIANKRWSKKQKMRLCNSRWLLTEHLAALIKASQKPPQLLISGSAIGYYADQGQKIVTEETCPNDGFTHQLCQRWEQLALSAQSANTRVCLLRTGVVLAADGGILAKMALPFQLGLGGPVGDGKQFLPWIDINDMVAAILFLLANAQLQGPFNIVSPQPLQNEQFAKSLARALKRPAFIRTPSWLITLIMGEAATLLLDGQRAIPKRLTEAGFQFQYSELEAALNDIFPRH